MTTSLIRGLKFEEAADAVANKALSELKPGDKLSVWTEHGKQRVLVGIARPSGGAIALTIDVAEYDAAKVLQMIGVA